MSFRAFRFPANALQNVGPGAFQTHYECRIPGRDLKDPEILTDELFMNCRDTLRAGDQITVCGFVDQKWERLSQFVHLRVYHVGKDGVKFAVDGKVTDIPREEGEKEPEIIEKAWAKRGAPGEGFNVFDKDNNLLGNYKTMVEAREHAARVNAGGAI